MKESCILFFFYIKPQHIMSSPQTISVVSYSFSTSNHNDSVATVLLALVVSYSFSTSNHNTGMIHHQPEVVVSYSFSTSNHNPHRPQDIPGRLYLILFLHQTTTLAVALHLDDRCILFFFYIKPQPCRYLLVNRRVVSYSFSTSNHNVLHPP